MMFMVRLGTQSITLHLDIGEIKRIVSDDPGEVANLRSILGEAVMVLEGVDRPCKEPIQQPKP